MRFRVENAPIGSPAARHLGLHRRYKLQTCMPTERWRQLRGLPVSQCFLTGGAKLISQGSQNASFSTSIPVYVWIYGGGFTGGSSYQGTGIYSNFVNRGPIIMVSLAYRLGIFGMVIFWFLRLSMQAFTARETP